MLVWRIPYQIENNKIWINSLKVLLDNKNPEKELNNLFYSKGIFVNYLEIDQNDQVFYISNHSTLVKEIYKNEPFPEDKRKLKSESLISTPTKEELVKYGY